MDIKKTGKAKILLELNATAENKGKYGVVLQIAILDADLYVETEAEDVKVALRTFICKETANDLRHDEDCCGSLMAFLELKKMASVKLSRAGRINIGWVNCRVRMREKQNKYFQCDGYGHIAATCKADYRGKQCWKCGSKNHKAVQCANAVKFCICVARNEGSTVNHIPGLTWCVAYAAERQPQISSRKKGQGWGLRLGYK